MILDTVENIPNDSLSPTRRNIGRIGENLAAYYLERAGISCTIVDRKGSDIWCNMPSGKMFRLEVKTTLKESYFTPKDKPYGKLSCFFTVQNKTSDQYMFINLRRRLFIIKSRDELTKSGMTIINCSDFIPRTMQESLNTLFSTYA
jgi:hypothetical protein